LIVSLPHVLINELYQFVGYGKVGEALREIDGIVVESHLRHYSEDGRAYFGKAGFYHCARCDVLGAMCEVL
jgi:hypothetical protein